MRKTFVLIMILALLSSPFTFGNAVQAAAEGNVALGKPASSDSELSGYEAGMAVDAEEWSTNWAANDGSFPHWLEVDLQGSYDLSGATVIWNAWSYINQYTIEVSRDHKVWITVADQSQSVSTEQTQYNAFKMRNISYVRVTVTGINGGKWAAVNDVKIWGVPAGTNAHEPQQGVITSVLPIRLDTEVGKVPELPNVVTAVYGDSGTEDAEVTWDVLQPADYSRPGTITVGGSVSATLLRAVAEVTVTGDSTTPISGFEPVEVATITDVPAVLPSAVKATYEDGSSKQLPVVWNDLSEAQYAVEGVYTITGQVDGTEIQPTAVITVTALVLQSGFIKGADISTLQAVEDAGGKYYDHGVEKDLLDILKSRGVNYIRLRIWNDPEEAGGYNDREHVVELAQRVKAKGFKLLLDFHYSDFWADPGKQNKPGAWVNYSYEELKQAVYDYTHSVMEELKEKGASPDMVQIGNEINGGMLWPDGKSYDQENAFDKLVPLLNSGVQAVRDAQAVGQNIKIMIHLAEGGKNDTFRWFFDELTKRNLDYDVIGASFYPYWSGTLDSLQYNLDDISKRYGKEVIVAETAYPFTLEDADGFENNIARQDQLDGSGFPATVAGQKAEVKTMMNVVSKVPEGKGTGIFYWEPAWIPAAGVGWKVGEGNAWENQAMFDFAGNALPSLDVFKTPVTGEDETPGDNGSEPDPGNGEVDPGTGEVDPGTGEPDPGTVEVAPSPVIVINTGGVNPASTTASTATVVQAEGQLQVKALVGSNGIAKVTLTADELKQAVAKLPDNGKLVITIQPAAGESIGANVEIPLASLLELGKRPQLVIVCGAASITVSTEAGAGIVKDDAKIMTVSLSGATSIPIPQQLSAGTRGYPAYDFHLAVDGVTVNQFNKPGAVVIAMNYSLKPGEKGHQIAVYSISADGKYEYVRDVQYDQAAEQIVFQPRHFSTYAAGYVIDQFTDLNTAGWASQAIETLTARGVVQGTGNGQFVPQGNVTRAEYVSMLLSALQLTTEQGSASFPDVHPESWYYPAVITAGKLGIVQGLAGGDFGPSDFLTREEMAVISCRALKLINEIKADGNGSPVPFKDKNSISPYASEAVTFLEQAGFIKGFGDGSFKPQAHTSRAEAASIVSALMQQ
ncbi:glycosyl hydrolase 53 family protein [Paenibacillus monticola]|uniref:Arabinogalactan endo-beta-1,4-galactanase n=1 Tax=Paenibacillus monticola TaxID=2666075 RepID=A0A7X2L1T0_9BACL|nr:glycosyl hydrolase 53 family protein [Paenibacillus monticola]MRN53455.1 hypothetical protein [Paenibacillus monticola]